MDWKTKFKIDFNFVADGQGNRIPLVLNDYMLDKIIEWIEKEILLNAYQISEQGTQTYGIKKEIGGGK